MMHFLKQYQAVIGLVAVVAAAFIAYTIFFAHPAEPALTQTSVATSQDAVDQQLIALLLTLHGIKLDASLFDNPKFKSLKDYGKELVPEPVGRPNPFAPLSP
jgi:hypothetical protein